MRFRVGPFIYRVRVVRGYIEHDGTPCLGLCDNDRHELLVSDQTSDAQRIQIVCHEYMEAWLYHFAAENPGPGKEQMCDLFGLAMTQFIVDFMHQTRRAMNPALDPAPTPAPGSGTRGDSAAGFGHRAAPHAFRHAGNIARKVASSQPGGGRAPSRIDVRRQCDPVPGQPGRFWVTQIFAPAT